MKPCINNSFFAVIPVIAKWLTVLVVFVSDSSGMVVLSAENKATKVETETRDLPPFHTVKSDLAFDIDCEISSKSDIRIYTEKTLVPHITTRVENGELVIDVSHDTLRKVNKNGKMTYKMVVDNDEPICVDHVVKPKLWIRTPNLDRLEVVAEEVKVRGLKEANFEYVFFGNHNTSISGQVENFIAKSLGPIGNLRAAGLRTKNTSISGPLRKGDVEVQVTDTLTVDCSGPGKIQYLGSPKITDKRPDAHAKIIKMY